MAPPAPLRCLTGLRFAAAAAVAGSHLWYVAEHPSLPRFVHRVFAEGPAGVAFFFVLSGFILAYTYRDRFPTLNRSRLGPYYIARVGRVWPVHLFALGLAAAFPYLPADGTHGWPYAAKLLAHAFLLQGWVPDPRFAAAFNSVAWTLSVEAFFYLCLPGMLWLAGRFPNATPRQLLRLAGLVWLAELGYAASFTGREDAVGVWLAGICPPARLFEFTVGVLTGLAFARRNDTRLAGPPPAVQTRYELTAVIALFALVAFAGKVPPLLKANGYYTAAMAAVVWAFAHQRGRLSGLFASHPAVFLGEISFAFYLLHCLTFFHIYQIAGGTVGVVPLAVLSVAAALMLSAAVHMWVEQPARRGIVEAYRRWSQTGTTTASTGGWVAALVRAGTRRPTRL